MCVFVLSLLCLSVSLSVSPLLPISLSPRSAVNKYRAQTEGGNALREAGLANRNVQRLASENAALVGHNNNKQKIKHLQVSADGTCGGSLYEMRVNAFTRTIEGTTQL